MLNNLEALNSYGASSAKQRRYNVGLPVYNQPSCHKQLH